MGKEQVRAGTHEEARYRIVVGVQASRLAGTVILVSVRRIRAVAFGLRLSGNPPRTWCLHNNRWKAVHASRCDRATLIRDSSKQSRDGVAVAAHETRTGEQSQTPCVRLAVCALSV
jgi:hypothetical protein